MADTERSRRLVPVTSPVSSSANLPQPSSGRVNIAQIPGQALADFSQVIQGIGLQQVKIERENEIKNAVLDAEQGINNIIATNTKKFINSTQFQTESQKEINSLLKGLGKNRGPVVGRELEAQFKDLRNRSNLSIAKQGLIKTQDSEDALLLRVKEDAINNALIGVRGGDPTALAGGLAKVQELLDRQVADGTRTLEQREKELAEARKSLALGKFNIELQQDPILALKNLEKNKDISEELRISVTDKAVRKVNQRNKLLEEERRVSRIQRSRDLFSRARRGEATEDDLIKDANDNPLNPLSEGTSRVLLNKVYEVEAVGGPGNPAKFNEMKKIIRRNAKALSIDDIYTFEDAHGLNTDQSEKLEDLWEKRITGANDPNDITTFREFDDGMEFVELFAPSEFDTGSELGIKKLRGEQAESFAEGRAQELFEKNKNVDSVMAQVRVDTMKHMEDYDRLVREFILKTPDLETASVFDIESKVIPELQAIQRARAFDIEAQGKIFPTQTAPAEGLTGTEKVLDEIEALFDRAEEEGRDLTETEIDTINELQEIPVGNNTGT